jgi:hypothetical protein
MQTHGWKMNKQQLARDSEKRERVVIAIMAGLAALLTAVYHLLVHPFRFLPFALFVVVSAVVIEAALLLAVRNGFRLRDPRPRLRRKNGEWRLRLLLPVAEATIRAQLDGAIRRDGKVMSVVTGDACDVVLLHESALAQPLPPARHYVLLHTHGADDELVRRLHWRASTAAPTEPEISIARSTLELPELLALDPLGHSPSTERFSRKAAAITVGLIAIALPFVVYAMLREIAR